MNSRVLQAWPDGDRTTLPDLQQCAQEPIRTPAAIQPHGRLAVLSPDGQLLAWSGNWPGAQAAQQAIEPLSQALLAVPADEGPAALGKLMLDGSAWDAVAHRRGGNLLVELEPAGAQSGVRAPIYQLTRSFLPQLERADSVQALAELAAVEMKQLAGFGRAVVYRFDEDGHGHVLAEALDPGYDSYLGHRFPASDVPAQARELYQLNHIRLIANANYTPVPIHSRTAGFEKTLDLSFAGLRSVSPVHLEYMRNMGTLASMSVSIVIGGKLWGLISCHDHDPRYLDFEARAACEHLGRLLSLQIDARENGAEVEARLELRKLTLEIVSRLAEGDATLERLLDESIPLLRMARAGGAAVVLNDNCWCTGDTPEPQQILDLAQWIVGRASPTFATDQLPQEYPPAAQWQQVGAGVLAISISQVHRHLVLWFRPEQVRNIRWAGPPEKVRVSADGRIHPRKSFAAWMEQVRGRSDPWRSAEVAAAAELRHALIGIVLRRAEELADVAAELGRVNKELEAFSYTVSHDLRAPMRHITGYLDLVQEQDGERLSERSHRYLGNVRHAAAYAGQLVDALLDFSRMGRAELKRVPVSMQLLVREVVGELSRMDDGARVEWDIAPDLPTVRADPFLMQVVVRNLLGNAVKYSRGRHPPQVRIASVRRSDGDGLEVSDNGVGFQQAYSGKLFGVFQRLHNAEDFEGTGIGLASVRRIVERHGGTVWAHGEPGQGARFGFILPGQDTPPSIGQQKEVE
ncbi:GAF domain-containing protein [Ramlibacter sp. AW1]|uniref:histidine kinase n=1 Tax=Ramlibacter aurantiacus TaxID=2801330 RepID=A0A936ZS07_9BURK|nr:ATP-binding protein [Ramlibacter aurantiacus]MBL0420030.1 GAF domain-containing protein [Ramlibacter aurantiacus]